MKLRDPLLPVIATLVSALLIAATITTSTASCLEVAVETRKSGSIVIYDTDLDAEPITRYKLVQSWPKKSIEIGALKAGDTNSACRRAPDPRRSAD